MNKATPAIRNLARQLLAREAEPGSTNDAAAHVAIRAFEKLRLHLSKLLGVAGVQALLMRALMLAESEVSWLEGLEVNTEGKLEGFAEIAQKQDREMAVKGSNALLAQLLGLLVTFIGEAMTLRLVQEVWPEARLGDRNSTGEETSA